jgi:hypothetical protein
MTNFERELILGFLPLTLRHSTFPVRYSTFRDEGRKVGRLEGWLRALAGHAFPDIAENIFAKKASI